MDCKAEYDGKFDEIISMAALAEDDNHPLSHTQVGTICRSGLVLLCGYFEGYVRAMCKEFVDKVNDAEIKAKDLPNSILCEHTSHCIEYSQKNNIQPFADFIVAITADGILELNSKKLSATNANPTVDNVERLFANFDIPLVLDTLTLEDYEIDSMYNSESHITNKMYEKISLIVDGNVESRDGIISLIQSKWPSKTKRRRVGYLALIDELLRKRNSIAHGEQSIPVTISDLKDATESIRKLCDKLAQLLDSKFVALTS